jgi:ubiquinone/menaquinone biosynthesis C-methylase UbiE
MTPERMRLGLDRRLASRYRYQPPTRFSYMTSTEQVILEHYRKEAALCGAESSSTMRDAVTRAREVSAIKTVLNELSRTANPPTNLLDIGCGNGHLLELLRESFPALGLTGLEYTPDMVAIARDRAVRGCEVIQGDVRKLPMQKPEFDVVITERCVINVMNQAEQELSLKEIARVLRPGGHFICIEAFTDGLEQLNEARQELGLEPNVVPHHNIWFDKEWFLRIMDPLFSFVNLDEGGPLPPPNFLSSHYFISRVLYAAVTKREIIYNTHFVRFFSFLQPVGNYSPIQFYVLRRK